MVTGLKPDGQRSQSRIERTASMPIQLAKSLLAPLESLSRTRDTASTLYLQRSLLNPSPIAGHARSMQAYRTTPAPIPLLSLVAGRLIAIDAASGLLRWERPVAETMDRVLVAGGTSALSPSEQTVGFDDLRVRRDASTTCRTRSGAGRVGPRAATLRG